MTQVRVRQVLKRVLIPPLTDRRFWVVQLLTVLINLAIFTLWHVRLLVGMPLELAVPMIDVANLLFLVPVLYAALNFGLVGAVATAVLVAVFRGVFLILWHGPIQLLILGAVYATVLAVAVFVGERVEQEVGARREAEAARNAASASEAQFRRLFEDSPAPTVLLDMDAAIRRANPAAVDFFGRSDVEMVGAAFGTIVGEDRAAAIVDGLEPVLELPRSDGHTRFVRPVVSRHDGAVEGTLQVVFVDVSEERRQLGVADAYAAAMLRAQEEERSRIAQELHDEPLQQVVQLCHQLDRASAADPAGPALAAARRTAEGVAGELRRLAGGLRPPALDELGLPAALRMVARGTQERAPGVRVRVVIRGRERRLDPVVELNLFRIAQEALRNAERHADASRVAVTLAYRASDVHLSVADDGRGFATNGEGEPAAERLGLVGMRERARVLGGSLRVASAQGAGTRIEVSITLGLSSD